MSPAPRAPRNPEPCPWQVRDASDEIVASFATEGEAYAYGSQLANANPDDIYGIYYVRTITPASKEPA